MINNIYSIYDSGSETFMPMLLIERSDKLAVRKAKDMYTFGEHCVKEGRTSDLYAKFVQYPTCFSLVRLGTIDDETGLLVPLDVKQEILNFTMFTDETQQNLDKLYNKTADKLKEDFLQTQLNN